jgi:hypothetical protein
MTTPPNPARTELETAIRRAQTIFQESPLNDGVTLFQILMRELQPVLTAQVEAAIAKYHDQHCCDAAIELDSLKDHINENKWHPDEVEKLKSSLWTEISLNTAHRREVETLKERHQTELAAAYEAAVKSIEKRASLWAHGNDQNATSASNDIHAELTNEAATIRLLAKHHQRNVERIRDEARLEEANLWQRQPDPKQTLDHEYHVGFDARCGECRRQRIADLTRRIAQENPAAQSEEKK